MSLGAIIFGWLVTCFAIFFITALMVFVSMEDLKKYLREKNYRHDLEKLSTIRRLSIDSFAVHSYLFGETDCHDDETLLALKNWAKKCLRYFYTAFIVCSCSLLVALVGGLLYSFS